MAGFDEIFDGVLISPAEPAAPAADVPRILVVDDNSDLADAVRLTLEGRYRIEISRTLEDALERLAAGGLDLVLLDIQMAANDGIECFRAFRDRWPRLKIVFHTAYAGSSEKAKIAEALDHDGILYKGEYSGRTLADTIRAALKPGESSVTPAG